MATDPQAWMARGGCVGVPGAMFPDPKDGEGNGIAKSICGGCPVVVPCLDYAVATNQQEGVWGGMGEIDRQKYRRRVLRRHRLDLLSGQPSLFVQ